MRTSGDERGGIEGLLVSFTVSLTGPNGTETTVALALPARPFCLPLKYECMVAGRKPVRGYVIELASTRNAFIGDLWSDWKTVENISAIKLLLPEYVSHIHTLIINWL